MNVVLVSPLYPPDTEAPAPYIKELASRIRDEHKVTILTYGEHPEEISGVRIVAISKKCSLPRRLMTFTRALVRLGKDADVVFLENGPSVELPALIARMFGTKHFILHTGDPRAALRSSENKALHFLRTLVAGGATYTLSYSPLPRPEIFPLESYPEEALRTYEESWRSHLGDLKKHMKPV